MADYDLRSKEKRGFRTFLLVVAIIAFTCATLLAMTG